MVRRAERAREGGGPSAAAVLALLGVIALLGGCSSYDRGRLGGPAGAGGQGSSDAGMHGGSGGAGGSAGRGGSGGGGSSGGGTGGAAGPIDGGADADAPDAFVSALDAALDAGSQPDAGCVALNGGEDCCPDDDAKTRPGQCGCGTADDDGDDDDTADCDDDCPDDATKTAPGICGCGRADTDQGSEVSCAGLVSALLHRYRFDGSSAVIDDSVGSADGTAINTTLPDTGQLDLAGGTSNQYVDLPNGLISSLSDATIEVWLSWNGSASWERICDFGDNDDATEGNQGNGESYLFITPRAAGSNVLRAAFSVNGSANETRVNAAAALPSTGVHHVAVVADDTGDALRMYVDGALVGSAAWSGALSGIRDINNWLGRSQYATDSELGGSLHELRIYGAALSDAQLSLSAADGPDPAYLEP